MTGSGGISSESVSRGYTNASKRAEHHQRTGNNCEEDIHGRQGHKRTGG